MGRMLELALRGRGANPVEGSDPLAEVSDRLIARAVALLLENAGCRYAIVTDVESDPDSVLVAIAIKDRAACEVRIPRDRYDGVLLVNLIDRYGAIVH
jgi:hypothetical protein